MKNTHEKFALMIWSKNLSNDVANDSNSTNYILPILYFFWHTDCYR